MRRRTAIPAAALLLLASCSNAADAEPAEPPFKAALDECSLPEVPSARLGDDGTTFILNGAGEEDGGGLSPERMECLLDALDIPDGVSAQMGATRALDGTQTASWGHVSASWTYHPADGLDIVLTFTPEDD